MTSKPGLWVTQEVIENDAIRSGTYNFLLTTFHSNHRPISFPR